MVNVYQYCSSHHAGDTKSVTDRAFFGSVRNLSSGDWVSVSIVSTVVSLGAVFPNAAFRDPTGRFHVSQTISTRLEGRQVDYTYSPGTEQLG